MTKELEKHMVTTASLMRWTAEQKKIRAQSQSAEMTRLYWLSFATTERFLGGCVVHATSMIEAVKVSHALGINPGGEVMGHPVIYPPGIGPVPEKYVERLLTKEECEQMDKELCEG